MTKPQNIKPSADVDGVAAPSSDDELFVDSFDSDSFDGDQFDREDRQALRRVAGLSTELQDVTEVEYRQLRLERVVLVGVWTEGTLRDAENSLIELKLLADVGLVGYPNAGKSTLISRLSAAHPKIADYPFTTLEPQLGVVQLDDFRTFVIADIPGLIEGAHLGQGLGIQFLRHIERTRLLAHLVDVSESSGREPVHDFEVILQELAAFSADLAAKPMLLVATKIDVAQNPARVESLRALAAERGLPFFAISSVTGEGLEQLRYAMAERVLAG